MGPVIFCFLHLVMNYLREFKDILRFYEVISQMKDCFRVFFMHEATTHEHFRRSTVFSSLSPRQTSNFSFGSRAKKFWETLPQRICTRSPSLTQREEGKRERKTVRETDGSSPYVLHRCGVGGCLQ